MTAYNFSQFIKRVTLKPSVPLQKIYAAWTTREGLESWFLRMAEFTAPSGKKRMQHEPAEAGDSYKWSWFGYDDSIAEQQEVLAVNGENLFRFGFSGGCIVTVTIKEEKAETICELLQQMPVSDAAEQQYFYIECGKGWTFYLANLKSILEGGIDLRNKNAGIQNVLNA
jgi:uncharacterized protein YndB with AHSA1/START domain